MALTEIDKFLLTHHKSKISEQDFEKLSIDEQDKILKEASNAYLKMRSSQKKPEYIENVKNVLPKIKEQFAKPIMIYAKNVGQNTGEAAYAVCGSIPSKNLILLYNPESIAEKLKVYQVDEKNIISSTN